jgi:hypothetical protein
MQQTDRERQLAAARHAAGELVTRAHQVPVALSLAFEPATVISLCEQIRKLAQTIERAVADVAAGPQELNE